MGCSRRGGHGYGLGVVVNFPKGCGQSLRIGCEFSAVGVGHKFSAATYRELNECGCKWGHKGNEKTSYKIISTVTVTSHSEKRSPPKKIGQIHNHRGQCGGDGHDQGI